ncbi:hypothetical protein RJ639_007047 [Escallonia herrerae]|uniref:Scarecrow-like protein 9 n=1 Tax=Escallonia herrerae TaxID=1293975 RepID=A0AA88W3F1_9ASTE|nr:hypothetical protein RJ639_007047 [Escallonia herrerae]
MDPRCRRLSGSMGSEPVVGYPDRKLVNGHGIDSFRFESNFLDQNFGGVQFLQNDPSHSSTVPSLTSSAEEELHEDCDFSDEILRYISQILMEEDLEDKTCMLQESLDLQAAEKSFYDVLGEKYPPSPQQNPPSFLDRHSASPDDYFSENCSNSVSSSSNGSAYSTNPSWINSPTDSSISQVRNPSAYHASPLSVGSSNSVNNFVDGLIDSPISPLQIRDLYNESQSIWQFKKGVEEANKFLPSGNQLLLNTNGSGWLPKVEKKDEGDYSPSASRGRKNPHRHDVDSEEERSSKQAAVYPESTVRSEEFDLVLLCSMGKGEIALSALREKLRNGTNKKLQQDGQPKGYSRGKGRPKKQNRKKEVIDLRTLLILCAQAVAADDRKSATELLKQIRQHSSPFGDGSQRLALQFADGLQARLAGTGSQIHKALISKRTPASDYLKAYHLYLASCPFRKISNFASNRTIMDRAENATRIHIIDFGILYGFQWPTLIQRISAREGGPPKLRVTGIDFPQPGFRPAERIEEAGRRLADYARTYNVPFEYSAIAKKWETVKLEELKIDKDEFLVVNCLYRSKNLLDETVSVDSPKSIVLKLMRNINPDLFIHGIINGAYSAPFFVTRFREALFHFSALFDMLETNVPREHNERMLIEREIFGREALNVIACEGWERVERPETYKQWHVRNLRAGFMQLAFDRGLMKRAVEKVRTSYHKDFMIDEDSQWLLQGWKGRIIYALSCWKSV